MNTVGYFYISAGPFHYSFYTIFHNDLCKPLSPSTWDQNLFTLFPCWGDRYMRSERLLEWLTDTKTFISHFTPNGASVVRAIAHAVPKVNNPVDFNYFSTLFCLKEQRPGPLLIDEGGLFWQMHGFLSLQTAFSFDFQQWTATIWSLFLKFMLPNTDLSHSY